MSRPTLLFVYRNDSGFVNSVIHAIHKVLISIVPGALSGTSLARTRRLRANASAVIVRRSGSLASAAGPAATCRHYLAARAEQDGKQRAARRVITGGRRG